MHTYYLSEVLRLSRKHKTEACVLEMVSMTRLSPGMLLPYTVGYLIANLKYCTNIIAASMNNLSKGVQDA